MAMTIVTKTPTNGLWMGSNHGTETEYSATAEPNQQQVLYPKSPSTPMISPWVKDTLVLKSNWCLKEACEVGAKRSCGVQTEAGEDVLCSQWVPTNPRKAEASRRRGLLPTGRIADSF